ncbi:OsmC family protein [Flavicella sp.]|uniref:OsmC family protein n=1 Tax=Flavicella sp. TaxID=2957742 RepID=UPI00301840D4
MTHNIKLNWKGKMHFESEGPGGKVLIDGVEKFGGEGKGIRPKAMMLSALAGCAGMDISFLLKKMRAEVAGFSIDVSGELTDVDPKFYKKVHVTFKFYGSDFATVKIEKAVKLSVEKYCGVMEMFRQFAEVTVSTEYIDQ